MLGCFTLNPEASYNYLTTGVRASKRTGGFTEPTAGPTVGTMHTLNEIMEAGIIPPKTGQTNTYAVGDDGTNQIGLAWPNPRFSPVATNGAATNQIRDNLTGLIWARNANMFGVINWGAAVTNCNDLIYGGTNDWRLPNWQELRSLIDASKCSPALPAEHPFAGVQSSTFYWSSSTRADGTDLAWNVHLYDGRVNYIAKVTAYYVWPVRGGQ